MTHTTHAHTFLYFVSKAYLFKKKKKKKKTPARAWMEGFIKLSRSAFEVIYSAFFFCPPKEYSLFFFFNYFLLVGVGPRDELERV